MESHTDEVDMGDLHPDRLEDTQREMIALLDAVDACQAALDDFVTDMGVAEDDYGYEVVSERTEVAINRAQEKLGIVTWLIHRQEVKRNAEAAEHLDELMAEPFGPLKAGAKICTLTPCAHGSDEEVGAVLTVVDGWPDVGGFTARFTVRSSDGGVDWDFNYSGEGDIWERYDGA